MKKILLAILPCLLLVGCQSGARRQAEREAKLISEYSTNIVEAETRLTDIWNQIPAAAKTNAGVRREYHRLIDQLKSTKEKLAQKKLSDVTYDLQGFRSSNLTLQRAVKADQYYADTRGKYDALHKKVQQLCPGNARALYHLNEVRKDLEAAQSNGYALELTDLVGDEVEFIEKIVANPFEEPADTRTSVKLRDRLFYLNQTRAKLSPRKLAHLDAAAECVVLQRQSLARAAYWSELFPEMMKEHLQRVAPVCTEKKDADSTPARAVLRFDQILETEEFIAENCPENAEAARQIKIAREKLSGWKQHHASGNDDYTELSDVNTAIKAAREAIGNSPRKGTR